jgi:hypothetical protein
VRSLKRVKTTGLGALGIDDPAGTALWRLSLILREISENRSTRREKEPQPAASQQTALEVSSEEGSKGE